ncbi:MAG: hypothetical protein FJW88_06980 [Actinobacteria bacterium]|nr:hypothetical protein [Actinomycetota bacterium]
MRRWAGLALAAAIVVGSSGCAFVARSAVSPSGQQPEVGSVSFGSALSSDGRFAVFQSDAENLTAGADANGLTDVFLRDHVAGVTERISVGWDLANDPDPNNESLAGPGAVSTNGRYVVFESVADNLVADDTNGASDVFVRDRQTQTTVRVLGNNETEPDDGSHHPSISADGAFVAFESFAGNLIDVDENGFRDVFVWNRATGAVARMSQRGNGVEGEGESYEPMIDPAGRYVAFASAAPNLITGDTNEAEDVLVKDRSGGTLSRASLTSAGLQANSSSMTPFIAGAGRYVLFASYATDLVTGDTNGLLDVFVRDRVAGTTERVSVAGDGSQALGSGISVPGGISGDGRFALFSTTGTSLIAAGQSASLPVALVRDRTGGRTLKVTSRADGNLLDEGFLGSISDDGRYLLLASRDVSAVEPDGNGSTFDVFLRSTVNPLVLGLSPASVPRGASTTVSFLGTDLAPGSTILLGEGVSVTNVVFVSPSQIEVSISVAPNAVPGPRTPLLVDNGSGAGPASGGVAFLPDAFAVI